MPTFGSKHWLMERFRLSSDSERLFATRRSRLANIDHFLHDMSIIDAKSSALLSHVSIMLAVVAVFLAQAVAGVWKWVFIVELTIFSVVAVLLLRCVDILGPPFRPLGSDDSVEIEEFYRAEVLLRRAIFQGAVRVVRLLTVGIIVTVLAKGLS
jgi:hypothetical protein